MNLLKAGNIHLTVKLNLEVKLNINLNLILTSQNKIQFTRYNYKSDRLTN